MEKGAYASGGALKAFTSGMDLKERTELLNLLITRALDDGSTSVYLGVLKLLVLMALGTSDGEDNSRSSSQSIIKVTIDMGYRLAVRAIMHLEPRALVEVDTVGQTPLVYAAVKHQEDICTLLLKKGASPELLKPLTSGMDVSQRCELLDLLISKAMDGGSKSVMALKLLVAIALGTNYGDDSLSSSQSMMNAAIDMGHRLAVRAIIHFEPQVLLEVDTGGRTPFAYAYYQRQNEICGMLFPRPKWAMARTTEDVNLEGNLAVDVHTAIEKNCPQVLELLLGMDADVKEFIDVEGRTLLIHAAQLILNSETDGYGLFEGICRVLLDDSNVDIEAMKKMDITRIAGSMHNLVEKGFKSVLQLLSLTESRDAEGWTPLASAAFNLQDALCEFLVEKGCSLCLDTEQKKQLQPKLSCRIHGAAEGGHKTALHLLLDMGADINKRNSGSATALKLAVLYNHLSCVQILIARGAGTTISIGAGLSMLHLAARKSTNREMMKFLLDNTVETRKLVNRKDSNWDTPLHDCSFNSNQSPVIRLENIKMLVQASASLTIKNKQQKTPY